MKIPELTAQEVAAFIQNGDTVSLGGFSPSGTPKTIMPAVAQKAMKEHEEGREFKIHLNAGASVGDSCDGTLVRADAVISRIPYCDNKDMRKAYNGGKLKFCDLNLTDSAAFLRQKVTNTPVWGIVEACDIEYVNGMCRIYPTAATGIAPTVCRMAEKGIFIELNAWHGEDIKGVHDVYEIQDSWARTVIDIQTPMDRIGKPYIEVPQERIKGLVYCNLPDESRPMPPSSDVHNAVGGNVAEFIKWNIKCGVLNPDHLVFQSGVGSGANAVMAAMGMDKSIPDFYIYTEVFQDGPFSLLQENRVKGVSTGALTLSPENLRKFYDDIALYGDKVVVRPSEISNCPEVISRLGVCAMNTAIEVDIYGHVNSTKICGTSMMNGVGGSLDYTTSSTLSIFTCGSTAKDGKISSIVPFCSHIDHTEHHVDAVITEYGVADLRGKCPSDRVDLLIEIAHPDYRPLLREYQRLSGTVGGQTPHMLTAAFAFHDTYLRKGDMRLVDWNDYIIK